MDRNTFIGIIALLVILAGSILYAAMRPAPAKAPGTAETSSLPASGYTEHAPYYDIAANYATSTPLAAPADAAAVTLMRDFVGDTIAQFKTDGNFANLTPKDIQMMGFDRGRKETLQIQYLIASSPRTASYIFTTYEDTLGAHGNTFFRTFVFDLETGAALSLADLFTPGADYLNTLSSLARAKLPGVIGEFADTGMIAGGTTPEEKNFENFFFDNSQLVILFAPYQVAPYSSGPQTLRIPVEQLSNVLKPEYR